MLWVRDYTDSDSHPQMLKAGYHGRQIFRFLCRVSGCHELNGKLPDEYLDPAYLVAHVGIKCCNGCPVPTVTHAADGVTSLYAVRLLVRNAAGVTEIDGWARKQPRAPKSNAERQRELRARRNEKVTSRNALEERRREEKRGDQDQKPMSADADTTEPEDQLVALWNQTAAPPMPRCEGLKGTRRQKARDLLKVVPLARWPQLIANANASDFCRAMTDRGDWKLSLAGMLKTPELALKVLEGNYANAPTKLQSPRRAPIYPEDRAPKRVSPAEVDRIIADADAERAKHGQAV